MLTENQKNNQIIGTYYFKSSFWSRLYWKFKFQWYQWRAERAKRCIEKHVNDVVPYFWESLYEKHRKELPFNSYQEMCNSHIMSMNPFTGQVKILPKFSTDKILQLYSVLTETGPNESDSIN